MFRKAKAFFIKVVTPLHAGSGQDLGIVDLPIQREKHTGFPKIEASGLKGSIREVFEDIRDNENKIKELKKIYPDIDAPWKIQEKNENGEEVEITKKGKDERELTKFDQAISLVFGPEEGDAHAGALGFIDARILLFPVKSAKGVFAWITCPKVLERFNRDMELAGEEFFSGPLPKISDGECIVGEDSKITIDNVVILEEYAFKVSDSNIEDNLASKLEEYTKIDKTRLLILSDNDFADFVDLSTEVITRIRVNNETGTVQDSALFTEEYLPSETVMYSLALATPIFNKDKGIFSRGDKPEEEQVLEFWNINMPDVMQIGGNATIGKGIVEIIKC